MRKVGPITAPSIIKLWSSEFLRDILRVDRKFKKIQWNIAIKRPLLLLDATEDKLVNSHLNKELLGQ